MYIHFNDNLESREKRRSEDGIKGHDLITG